MMRALALTGPTASGKTALSLGIAEALGCEIISCDSMQIYKEMDIGTAKATAEERARAVHHMIDFLSPLTAYSAENYRDDAMRVAEDITGRGKIPLFVGGTGLYIDTLMRSRPEESPPSDPRVRERLLRGVETEEDRIRLFERLREVDPESAEKTHYNNLRRVVRALEIYEITGIKKSDIDRSSREGTPDIDVGMITLDFMNRDLLYARVDMRVDAMMKEGLLDEVTSLYKRGLLVSDTTAASAIGYKEMISCLEGRCTLDEAVEAIKLASRRYAKRQLTWFRHEKNVMRLFVDTEAGIIKNVNDLTDEAVAMAAELVGQWK